ncbi:CDP-glycerol glycerophosphotransferase family protein [Lactiplantibacillus plantarum]|uniref:CDP-glycerol glycerophosphotransferase family protein n=1 Tax=Lactiplantibacillus plantarum TaxID=1590 RepID=UPI0021F6D48C|nr:CDP-glycerol glycerophosphotransferase family protein [Lactiplantibacillus plantarum]MCW0154616.1 CDP-glycerol glycerophosphotransferase family protein [Lactiplantibacillus plantarum]
MDSIVPKKNRTVLFLSYEGKKISDSPRVVFDYLQAKQEHYEYIWAVNPDVDTSDLVAQKNVKIVNAKSPIYFWYLFRARAWVTNCSAERLFPVNYDKHIYVQSWHGIPLKKLGEDEPHLNFLTKSWYKRAKFDLLTAESEYDKQAFLKIFPATTNTEVIGLPRYAQKHSETFEELKCSLNSEKKTIMFAPTFREYNVSSQGEVVETQLLTKNNVEALSAQYNVLYRGHYFTSKIHSSSLIDVSSVENLPSLLNNVDLLISDYSSIVFDAAVQNIPVVLYTPDRAQYLKYRGMYVDPKDLGLPIFENSDELQEYLLSFDDFEELKKVSASVFQHFLYQGSREETLHKIVNLIGGR